MPLLTVILTFLFLFFAFLHTATFLSTGPFLSYLLHVMNIFFAHFTLSLLGILVLSFFLIRSYRMEKKFPFHKKLLFSFYHVGVVSILSFFLAFATLFIIAFFQLNIQAVLMNMNPNGFGVITSPDMILQTLETNNLPPQIVLSEHDQKRVAQEVSYVTTGQESFYGKYILRSIPGSFMLPVNAVESRMALIDKTLIFTSINASDLQKISPIVGYLYVKQYFPSRSIKQFPNIYLMSESKYVAVRSHDADIKVATIGKDLLTIKSAIASLSANITATQDNITREGKNIADSEYQREITYNKCVRDHKKSGTKSDDNFETICGGIKDQFNASIIPESASQSAQKKILSADQTQLLTYNYYDNFFRVQKAALTASKANLPFELGAFEPEHNIGILFNTTEPTRLADFFETVVHEYLHYASYVPNKKLASGFFEEGLTEYFARMTIQDTLQTKTNMGYPVYVKIITELMKIIPESELADIYFTKDEEGLEHALDRVYGDDFYKNNIVLFDSLQYTGNPTQIIDLANKIMKKIGGKALTKKDLMSTSSTLNK